MLKLYTDTKEVFGSYTGKDMSKSMELLESEGYNVYRIHEMINMIVIKARKHTQSYLLDVCLNFDNTVAGSPLDYVEITITNG